MADQAHTDLETLQALRTSLAQYGVDATHVVRAVASASARVIDQIAGEISARTAALAAAEDALQACSRKEGADCSGEAQRARRATERLQNAQAAYAAAVTAIGAHQGPRQRYSAQIEQLVTEGMGTLTRHTGRVEEYLGRAGASALEAGGSGGKSSASGGGGGTSASGGEGAIPGAPEGFALVPVDAIDTSDSGVQGQADFTKGYTPDDLAWAHHALHEQVLPAVRAGKGADYFQAKDVEAGRYGSRSLSDTYSGFFGDSAIKLERASTGGYTVGNGYHRIWVARQLGITHVVARVR